MGSYGRVQVQQASLTTYMVSSGLVVPAAATTDLFRLSGSLTRIIEILQVRALLTSGTNEFSQFVQLIKRSAANTGGAPVAGTLVPCDSTNPAGTALFESYAANPAALGAAVGTVFSGQMNIIYQPATGDNSYDPAPILYQAPLSGQGIILNGVAEGLCVNFNGVIPQGTAQAACNIIYIER